MSVRDSRTVGSVEEVPGIGPNLAEDLRRLGIHRTSELRGRDAGALYGQLCDLAGEQVDRCVLYAFRCAVYFASHSNHDPELLKWWNWTDDRMPGASRREPVRTSG